MQAIETTYKDHRFRSRLEARWAIFFDGIGLRWEYEPEGFYLSNGQKYLPDFRLITKNDISVWCEVKPLGFRGPGKIEVLANDFEKEVAGTLYIDDTTCNPNVLTSFVCLVGDPSYAIGPDFQVCPRCGVITRMMVHYYGFGDTAFHCNDCDHFTPGGGNHPLEKGLLAECFPHKGMIVVGESELTKYNKTIEQACATARAARFEFGRAPA